MNYYVSVLKNYAVFSGRASRSEYWYFVLFNFFVIIGLSIVSGVLGLSNERGESLLVSFYQLAVLIPSIAVGVRRMHDVNKSGWFLLIPIYNLILAVTPSAKEENKYGPLTTNVTLK